MTQNKKPCFNSIKAGFLVNIKKSESYNLINFVKALVELGPSTET